MNVLPLNNLSSFCISPKNLHKICNQQKNYNHCDTNMYHTYPVTNISFHANLSKVPSQLERFEGCLLGGAIGDAFGALIEALTMSEIKTKYGKNGLQYIPKFNHVYEVTDDTQMSLFTIEGLLKSYLQRKSLKVEPNYSCIYDSYQDWYKTQTIPYEEIDNKKGLMSIKELYQRKLPGETCLKSLSYHIPGTTDMKLNNSAGNGGIMRVAPIGIMYKDNPEMAFKIGMKTSALTHSHPNAYLSAGYLSSLIAYLSNNHTIEDSIVKSNLLLKKYPNSTDIQNKINLAIDLANKNINSEDAISSIGLGNTGDEALSIALYSILKSKDNFKDALTIAINHSGDSDTTGAITGNIVGTILGSQKIPRNYRENIQFSEKIHEYAKIIDKISQNTVETDNVAKTKLLNQWSFDKFSSI